MQLEDKNNFYVLNGYICESITVRRLNNSSALMKMGLFFKSIIICDI
jgi:hypothetical protein